MNLDLVLKATYDTEADAFYVQLPNNVGNKAKSTMQINDTTLADVDENGNIIGLEILLFSKRRKLKK